MDSGKHDLNLLQIGFGLSRIRYEDFGLFLFCFAISRLQLLFTACIVFVCMCVQTWEDHSAGITYGPPWATDIRWTSFEWKWWAAAQLCIQSNLQRSCDSKSSGIIHVSTIACYSSQDKRGSHPTWHRWRRATRVLFTSVENSALSQLDVTIHHAY